MENNRLSRSTYSFGVSLAVCAVLNAALVVAKESNKTVADWMQKITGHHWMTHVLFVLTVFVALGWLLNRRNSNARTRNFARLFDPHRYGRSGDWYSYHPWILLIGWMIIIL